MRNPAFHSVLLALTIAAFSIISGATAAQSALPDFGSGNVSAYAPTTEPAATLTLAAAIQLALANNPDIALARREYAATEGALIQGQARPNPELSFMQEDTRSATRSSALQINLPIEMGGKRQARIDASQRGRELAAAELIQRQSEVRAAVIGAFFDVLSAQERIRLAQETLSLTQRVTDITGKRVIAGKISPVEETKARVAEAQVKVELSQAQGDLRVSRQKLSSLWGNATPRFERVDGAVVDLPEIPSVATLDRRVAVSPSLRRTEVELQRRVALTRVEQSKRTPDPTFSLGVKRAPESTNQILLGVSVPLPFFDGNQGNLLEALRREDKARDEITANRLRLQSEVLQARERLLTARAEVEALRSEVLPGALSAYEAAGKGFDAGKFSFLETLDAQRTLIQARVQYLRALAETHRAATEIERLLGDTSIEQKQ
jgi:cobalt-zinc-cadmium efflux system outer membrane protein